MAFKQVNTDISMIDDPENIIYYTAPFVKSK
jgi:hypothetical protein